MTIQQLKYLIEVAKCGSISKAAQNLFVTQPSVSNALNNLAKELDITIFEHASRGITLTVKGRELLSYAQLVIDQLDTIQQHFQDEEQNEKLHICISSQHYAFVADAFIQFQKMLEGQAYELFLLEGRTSEIIEAVSTQQSDFGVICLSSSTERFMGKLFHSKGLEFHEIRSFHPHVFLRKNHPLASLPQISLAQLAPYPYVAYNQGEDSFYFSEETLAVRQPRQTVYVKDRATMNNIIVHTNSFNIGTGCLLDGIIDSQLVSIPVSGDVEPIHIGWIASKERISSKESTILLRLICESLERCFFGF